VVCGFCAAGLFSGYGGRSLTCGSCAGISGPLVGDRRNAKPKTVGFSPSQDTLETLANLDDKSLYVRLARWMATASRQEIAAYWEIHRRKDPRDHAISELILINWTRLDPQAAIVSATTTHDGSMAREAWACTDPQAALAAAIAADPECLTLVARAIGKYHPEWLRVHFELFPESVRADLLKGTNWSDDANPLEALEFLRTNHQRINQEMLGTLIRKDPWSAYAWFRQNRMALKQCFQLHDWAMDYFAKTMGEWQPEALADIARQTSAGEFKRRMETALFDNLLRTNPQLAIEQAKAETAPRIAAERLAAVGLSLIHSDPAAAIEMVKLLVPICGSPELRLPDGTVSQGSFATGVYQLVDQLVVSKPEEMIALAISHGGVSNDGIIGFSNIAQRWAQEDLMVFADWVNQQSDPAVQAAAANEVISRLQYKKQYAAATEWVMSSETSQTRHLESFLRAWREDAPEDALQWLESTNLSPDKKLQLHRDTEPFGQ